jgi:hypothetical protein
VETNANQTPSERTPRGYPSHINGVDLFGCAAFVTMAFLVLGAFGSLFATEATIVDRLMTSAMTGGIAFVATVVLGARDRLRRRRRFDHVRNKLLTRAEINENVFLAHFPMCSWHTFPCATQP